MNKLEKNKLALQAAKKASQTGSIGQRFEAKMRHKNLLEERAELLECESALVGDESHPYDEWFHDSPTSERFV